MEQSFAGVKELLGTPAIINLFTLLFAVCEIREELKREASFELNEALRVV